MSEARVRVSITDRTIEIEGSESFVIAQLDKFAESIHAGLAGKRGKTADSKTGKAADANAAAKAARESELNRVFATTDRGLQILVDIPGDSVGQKMVNAARLLAYGMATLKNRKFVYFAEVRAVCRAHRCYDRTNMATTLKRQKSAFAFGGRRRKQTLALTDSGSKAVEGMLKTLSPAIA